MRSIEIGVKLMAARLADKPMPFTIGGFSVTAARATFAGSPRIYLNDRHSTFLGFVADEEGELPVGPFLNLAANLLAQTVPTDTVQSLNRDDRTAV